MTVKSEIGKWLNVGRQNAYTESMARRPLILSGLLLRRPCLQTTSISISFSFVSNNRTDCPATKLALYVIFNILKENNKLEKSLISISKTPICDEQGKHCGKDFLLPVSKRLMPLTAQAIFQNRLHGICRLGQ
jgi:hypothetical protein